MKKIKVGIFTSGFVPVSKRALKGTEVFTYCLCEGLAKAGLDVHLFASRGSFGNFKIINPRHSKKVTDNISSMYENNVYQETNFFDFLNYCYKNKIDIIHDQTTEITIGLARCSKIPIVATMHGIREPSNLSEYYRLNRQMYFISPSSFAVKASPDLQVLDVIHHGIDLSQYKYNPKGGDRFLWVGRIVQSKGLIDAMKAAQIAGVGLDIIGYSPPEMETNPYFDEALSIIRRNTDYNFIGKVEHNKISKYMGNAKALIMPTRCGECFGLVIVEAMACGTPVIAYNNGDINEIIIDGVNGHYVNDGDFKAMGESIRKIDKIKRADCRNIVEKKYSLDLMIKRYIKVYEKILSQNK